MTRGLKNFSLLLSCSAVPVVKKDITVVEHVTEAVALSNSGSRVEGTGRTKVSIVPWGAPKSVTLVRLHLQKFLFPPKHSRRYANLDGNDNSLILYSFLCSNEILWPMCQAW